MTVVIDLAAKQITLNYNGSSTANNVLFFDKGPYKRFLEGSSQTVDILTSSYNITNYLYLDKNNILKLMPHYIQNNGYKYNYLSKNDKLICQIWFNDTGNNVTDIYCNSCLRSRIFVGDQLFFNDTDSTFTVTNKAADAYYVGKALKPHCLLDVHNIKLSFNSTEKNIVIGPGLLKDFNLLFWDNYAYGSVTSTFTVEVRDINCNASNYLFFDDTNTLRLEKINNYSLLYTDRLIAEIWIKISGQPNAVYCIEGLKPYVYLDDVPFFKLTDENLSSSRVPADAKVVGDRLSELSYNTAYHAHNVSDIGCLDYQEIGDTDYSHVILYGQSLSMGWECPEAITTKPEKNCFMVGSSPMINHGNTGELNLNPLVAVKWGSGGEQPIVSMTNAFAKMYNRFVNRNQKFIGTNCGEGGRSIERLMKQCTNGTNYYTTEFLDTINSAKSTCDSLGKSISCSAIIYMQGEYNYTNLSGAGLIPGTDATNDKDQYKKYLVQLKNDMQSDIMSKYGQTKKPLFFIYQVAGSYINNKEMTINMAQVEFSMENDDVILLNSTYGMPDYSGGHLSTNGYRWYGELVAKQMSKCFIKGEAFKSVELEEVNVHSNKIELCFHVPVLPMVFDTGTKEPITNNGFRVYMNNNDVNITEMEIRVNKVILTLEQTLSGVIEITYGGSGRSGSGNLRDSDEYISMYTYYDDRVSSPTKREKFTPVDNDGNPIYGKNYPLYNWCNQFYKKITV